MPDSGKQPGKELRCAKLQTARIDARMAGEKFLFRYVAVNEEPDCVIFVVHQPHYADASGADIQKLLHVPFIGEVQAGDSELGRNDRGMELLVRRHYQKIKDRFLSVAQKQVFAYARTQNRSPLEADLHGLSFFVVNAGIFDPQTVQKVIGAYFLRYASFRIFWSACLNIHYFSFLREHFII